MSFLTLKTNDEQRSANSNVYLHAFSLGAQSAKEQADRESEQEQEKLKLDAQSKIAEQKLASQQAKQQLKETRENWQAHNEGIGKALDSIEKIAEPLLSNQDLDSVSRSRAADAISLIASYRAGLANSSPDKPFNPDLSRLGIAPPELNPQAKAAKQGKQEEEFYSGKVKGLDYKYWFPEHELNPDGSAVATDDASDSAKRAQAEYQAKMITSSQLAGQLRDLQLERKGVDPDDTTGKAKNLDESIRQKQKELDSANSALALSHAQVMTEAQTGGYGPHVAKAYNDVTSQFTTLNPYDSKSHDYYGSYINGRLSDPNIDENSRLGFSRLGSILNAGTRFADYFGSAPTVDSDSSHTPASDVEDWKSHFTPPTSVAPPPIKPQQVVTPGSRTIFGLPFGD